MKGTCQACAGHRCLCMHVCCSVCLAVRAVLMCPPTPQLRTQDMTLFKELKGNPEKPFSLTIEEPAPGTVACRLGELSKPIIRKFFYLNGEPRHLSALGAGSSVGQSGTWDIWVHRKGVSRVPGRLASW